MSPIARMNPPPENPAHEYQLETHCDAQRTAELIDIVAAAPQKLGVVVSELGENQLEIRYRDWTIRQIVHHLADSHVNAYVRFRWALTEENPTIKAYDEGSWVELPDARHGPIQSSLALLTAVHDRWVQLIRAMTPADFARRFFHPQSQLWSNLSAALAYYAWHGRHHTAQIEWLIQERGWNLNRVKS